MLDIKFIRENKEKVQEAAKNKGIDLDVNELLKIDEKRRELIQQSEDVRAQQKKLGKDGIEKAKKLKEQFRKLEAELKEAEDKFESLMIKAPTVPSLDTPVGKDDSENVEVMKWGEIPQFDFEPKTHIELGQALDILDIEQGTKVGGYRGYYVKNDGVLLMMGFLMHALQKMSARGYAPMIPPTLVKGWPLFGSGYFKGKEYDPEIDEIYQVATGDKEADGSYSGEKKFLVGTAEPSLLAYFSDKVLDEKELPLKVCGYSQCYRSEIGSYGKDTKGIYRVHEFMKIEQVVVSHADAAEADKLQEEMTGISQELHKDLGLPFRVLQICTGDMSAGKYKAFDIEAWMPGLNKYGETGSASNFLDWQARRLNIKYKDGEGNKKFAYLLNNTALASPRTFIAILENYQQKDGSVVVPKVLRPYLGGKERIIANRTNPSQPPLPPTGGQVS